MTLGSRMARGSLLVFFLSPAVLAVGLLLIADAVAEAREAGKHDFLPVTARVEQRADFIELLPVQGGTERARRVRLVLGYEDDGKEKSWAGRVDSDSALARRSVGDEVRVFVATDDPTLIDPDPPRLGRAAVHGLVGLLLVVAGSLVFWLRRIRPAPGSFVRSTK